MGRSTVGRLLTQMDFRLRVNHKKRSTAAPKDRDQQFRVIGRRRNRFARARDPIVSIDCKKKELVGNFTNASAAWKQHRIETLATDFRSDATGVAVPYGLYDTEANRGLVVVGTGRETPTFVTDCVATWWKTEGRKRYGRIPDVPVTRSHPPASWPSAANSSICRTYRKTAGEESRRRSPVANRWMRP